MNVVALPRLAAGLAPAPKTRTPLQWVATVWRIAQERRALADLDARMLADIGLSADAAGHEATRAPWDLPAGR